VLSIWRSPRHESNAVEAQQTSLCSDPQDIRPCLRNSKRTAVKDSVLNPPGSVCVLGDVASWINC